MANFIADDEHIIIFDIIDRPITRDGFVSIASAGVRTVLRNLEWIHIETTPGHYDWSVPDELVDSCISNGLKVLLLPNRVTACMPDDWYCWSGEGIPRGYSPEYSVFSPWHAEAQAYHDAFIRMAIDRYRSYPVQVIRGGTHGGESLLPYTPCYFDPKAIEAFQVWARYRFDGKLSSFNANEGANFMGWEQVRPGVFVFGRENSHPETRLWLRERLVEQVVHQQSMLVEHYGSEAWMMLAHCWHDSLQTGNFLIPDIVKIIMDRVKPTQVNWIGFAHFNMSSSLQAMALKRVQDGAQLWVGSQYCEGLPHFTGRAKTEGIRGFVCGPLSTEDGHDQRRIEPWMADNIRQSLETWRGP